MAFLQNRSISLVDMYIDNTEPSENVGQIHFSLEYDFQNTTLILRILTVSDKLHVIHITKVCHCHLVTQTITSPLESYFFPQIYYT
jgi:hypothetical protein